MRRISVHYACLEVDERLVLTACTWGRYEREGEFNHLVFLRDLEEAEDKVALELSSPKRDKSPPNSFEIASPIGSPNTTAFFY